MNVLQMCRALTSGGYQVDLATYPMGEPVDLPGLTIYRAPGVPGIHSIPIGFSIKKLVLDVALMLRVIALVVRRRYAVVHAVEEAVFFMLPMRLFGLPLVYDLDSQLSVELANAGVIRGRGMLACVRGLERLALRSSRAAITVCHSLSVAARALCGDVEIHQVEDAPLAETAGDPDPERVVALRSELGLQGRPVLVYTGNLARYQGIDLLLEALQVVRKDFPNVALVLVGGDDASVAAVHQTAIQLGIEESVLAVGARPPEEMTQWMGLADALVSPRTEGENTPLKLYTYMRSGRPIVATALPTHTQVLDEQLAILCDPHPAPFAAGLARALRGGGDLQEMAARARRLAETEYSAAAFERKLLAAYASILAEPRVVQAR